MTGKVCGCEPRYEIIVGLELPQQFQLPVQQLYPVLINDDHVDGFLHGFVPLFQFLHQLVVSLRGLFFVRLQPFNHFLKLYLILPPVEQLELHIKILVVQSRDGL